MWLLVMAVVAVAGSGTPCSSEQQCLPDRVPNGSAPRCLAGVTTGQGAFCVTDHNPHNASCACGIEVCNRTVATPAVVGKRQLLVIGDSISFGWIGRVASNLSKEWQLTHAGDHPNTGYGATDNNGNTNWISHCLWQPGGGWLGPEPGRWDAILLNAGLHDLASDNQHIELQTYKTLLSQTVRILAAHSPRAQLVWLTTTPAPTNPPTPLFPERLQSSVVAYNKAAALVVSAAQIPSCDLFSVITSRCGGDKYSTCPGIQKLSGIHYENGGWDLLAGAVAECVRNFL